MNMRWVAKCVFRATVLLWGGVGYWSQCSAAIDEVSPLPSKIETEEVIIVRKTGPCRTIYFKENIVHFEFSNSRLLTAVAGDKQVVLKAARTGHLTLWVFFESGKAKRISVFALDD